MGIKTNPNKTQPKQITKQTQPKQNSQPKQIQKQVGMNNSQPKQTNTNNNINNRLGECAYDFEALSESELNLKAGDLVDITDRSDPEWWFGTCKRTNQSGYFPKNYVKKYRAPENQSPPNGSTNHSQPESVETSSSSPSTKTQITPQPTTNPNTTNNNSISAPSISLSSSNPNTPPNMNTPSGLSNSTSIPLSSSGQLSRSSNTDIKLKMNLVALPKNDKNNQNSKSKGFFSNLFSKKKSKKHTPFFSLKYVFS